LLLYFHGFHFDFKKLKYQGPGFDLANQDLETCW
jgi:hypothetical protein